MTSSIRLFFLGGLTSYRALFNWLSPWILIPTFVLGPIFQILLFAFVGRAAGLGNDAFFVIGNAVQYAAIPCLFAMGNTIGDERRQSTLGLLLASPARRIPLFLGRALPVIVNGWIVALVALVVGALLLNVPLAVSSLLPLAVVVAVASFSCTGLGLVSAALALRVRETAVLVNIVFAVLLIFSGANIPLDRAARVDGGHRELAADDSWHRGRPGRRGRRDPRRSAGQPPGRVRPRPALHRRRSRAVAPVRGRESAPRHPRRRLGHHSW